MPPSDPFSKPPLSVQALLQQYRQRGMLIVDVAKAEHYLTHISYYRLGPYFRFFQVSDKDPSHAYRPGTTFDDGLNLYIFDRELRLLFLDALERIEVAVRTCISNAMSLRYGSHWFMGAARFDPNFNHRDFIRTIEERTGWGDPTQQPEFARHYFGKYTQPYLPPAWMVSEVLPLGTWSKLYNMISDGKVKTQIAKMLGEARPGALAAFLHRLTVLRNICAHHALLWCRLFQNSPYAIIQERGTQVLGTPHTTIYWKSALVQQFLNIIAPESRWAMRLSNLIASNPNISLLHMGFKPGWHRNPFWRIPPEPSYHI